MRWWVGGLVGWWVGGLVGWWVGCEHGCSQTLLLFSFQYSRGIPLNDKGYIPVPLSPLSG